MIHLNSVSISFSDTVILDKASLHIHKGQRVGLCAPNGTGKTTVLNCIAGRLEVNEGHVSVAPHMRLAYFQQQGVELGAKRIREELEEAYLPYLSLIEEISVLEHSLGDYADDLKKMQRVLDTIELLHGKLNEINYDNREADMQRILQGLGFAAGDIDRVGGEFSGGWQMRVGLAKVLLARPDILLLDEPTNHLDIEARMWLIDAVKKLPCTLLLISHDRYFLDHTVDSIVELRQGTLTSYAGNYSKYEVQLKNNALLLEKQRKQYEDEVKRQEAFIERFRYKATKARQVQSRIKALEKMPEPIDISNNAEIRLHFPLSRKSGDQVLEVVNVSKSYESSADGREGGTGKELRASETGSGRDGKRDGAATDGLGARVLDRINFGITWGEKVALLGPNGVGKSTLMRIITGQDSDYSGNVHFGSFVHCAYFSQRAADLLNEEDTVWDYILSIESDINDLARRKLLGAFLFSEDTIFKRIGMLSGGEKSRVLLCSIALQPCNFLVLDEPTNHLDLETQSLLLEALKEFAGTVLFTTHDRYLLEHLANKVIVLASAEEEDSRKTSSGRAAAGSGRETGSPRISNNSSTKSAKVTVYLGDYEYYLWKRANETAGGSPQTKGNQQESRNSRTPNPAQTVTSPTPPPPQKTQTQDKQPSANQNDFLLQKQKRAEHRKLEKQEAQVLEKIDNCEQLLHSLREKFADKDVYNNPSHIQELKLEITKTEEELSGLHQQWDQVHQLLENFSN